MTRRAAAFRQSDVARAIRAAQSAGLVVDRVEIDADGRIVVSSTKGATAPSTAAEIAADAFDTWVAEDARSPQGT